MLRRPAVCFLALLLLTWAGCSTPPEPLWYKPAKEYTTAEFNRDRDNCTKDKKLDQACMKAKGWVQVSPDRPEPGTIKDPEKRPTPY